MTALFQLGKFKLHSGESTNWKIECDSLTDDDWKTLASLIQSRYLFSKVVPVPRGGIPLAKHLVPNNERGPVLIVDDVLTTGNSMEEMRKQYPNSVGIVVFARREPPFWIEAIWTLGEAMR